MAKEKKKLSALEISTIYARWSRKYREEYHYDSLGFLYINLCNAGLNAESARDFIHSVYLIDSWDLEERIQEAEHYNNIQHAIDMGSDMGPMGDPYGDRF